MTSQATAETTLIVPAGRLFFKCPVGGFASLKPGLCPKCSEPLEPLFAMSSVINEQLIHGDQTTSVFS